MRRFFDDIYVYIVDMDWVDRVMQYSFLGLLMSGRSNFIGVTLMRPLRRHDGTEGYVIVVNRGKLGSFLALGDVFGRGGDFQKLAMRTVLVHEMMHAATVLLLRGEQSDLVGEMGISWRLRQRLMMRQLEILIEDDVLIPLDLNHFRGIMIDVFKSELRLEEDVAALLYDKFAQGGIRVFLISKSGLAACSLVEMMREVGRVGRWIAGYLDGTLFLVCVLDDDVFRGVEGRGNGNVVNVLLDIMVEDFSDMFRLAVRRLKRIMLALVMNFGVLDEVGRWSFSLESLGSDIYVRSFAELFAVLQGEAMVVAKAVMERLERLVRTDRFWGVVREQLGDRRLFPEPLERLLAYKEVQAANLSYEQASEIARVMWGQLESLAEPLRRQFLALVAERGLLQEQETDVFVSKVAVVAEQCGVELEPFVAAVAEHPGVGRLVLSFMLNEGRLGGAVERDIVALLRQMTEMFLIEGGGQVVAARLAAVATKEVAEQLRGETWLERLRELLQQGKEKEARDLEQLVVLSCLGQGREQMIASVGDIVRLALQTYLRVSLRRIIKALPPGEAVERAVKILTSFLERHVIAELEALFGSGEGGQLFKSFVRRLPPPEEEAGAEPPPAPEQ